LRVVSDCAHAAVSRGEIDNATRTEGGADSTPVEELDRRAQRIAHRAAEQTAFDPFKSVHLCFHSLSAS
jgi:hypothetical protein